MGAKRSVPGRCKPYDELLLEWQKANNPAFLAKLEKKEEERAKAMEEKRLKKLEKKKKKDAAAAAAAATAGGGKGGAGGGASGSAANLGPGGKKLVIGPDGQAGQWITASDGTKTFVASTDPNATANHTEALTSQFANDLFTQSVDAPVVAAEVEDLMTSLRKHFTDHRLLPQPMVAGRTHHGMCTSQARRFLMMRQAFASGGSGLGSAASRASAMASAAPTATTTAAAAAANGNDFRPPPIVAGGGWGPGMFASHS